MCFVFFNLVILNIENNFVVPQNYNLSQFFIFILQGKISTFAVVNYVQKSTKYAFWGSWYMKSNNYYFFLTPPSPPWVNFINCFVPYANLSCPTLSFYAIKCFSNVGRSSWNWIIIKKTQLKLIHIPLPCLPLLYDVITKCPF